MSTPNAVTLVGGADSVLINEINLPSGIIYKSRDLLRNVKSWHKFIVSNTDGLSRDDVLKAILDHVHPLDLIPVFFAKDNLNSNAYFLARNCRAAIEKLCKDNLTVDHPYNKKGNNRFFTPFKLSIIVNFSNTDDVKIDVQKNVLFVLNKRFNASSKTLNLDRFSEDTELSEFCTLSQPKIMYFVLHIAKNLAPEEIILSNNGIKLLNPLDVLIGLRLRALDLRNNELSSLNDLSSLKHFHLKELQLSGNILCDCNEDEYISKVRQLCPTVEILDGIPLSIEKFPVTKRYFLCDDTGFDLVNQFLEYFFTVFDTQDRKTLAELYHVNAMFSLTCVYLANQLSSSNALLKTYSTYSRNLKRAADLSRTEACLFKGRPSIMNVFETILPMTEHDPYSLSADLIYKTDTCAVIVVNGVFREISNSLLETERLLGFSRIFALEILNQGSRHIITNEQLHVYNCLTSQERNAFLQPILHNKLLQRDFLPKPLAKTDYTDLVTTLGHITQLKEDWARKCLEECHYDLKKSLELFVDLYKGDKIPREGFVETSPEQSYFQKSKHVSSETNLKKNDSDFAAGNADLNNQKRELRNQTVVSSNTLSELSGDQLSKGPSSVRWNVPLNVFPIADQTPVEAKQNLLVTNRNGLEVNEKSVQKPLMSVTKQPKRQRVHRIFTRLR